MVWGHESLFRGGPKFYFVFFRKGGEGIIDIFTIFKTKTFLPHPDENKDKK